ncbi:SDR family NAD(P)-dependent oxidoreductase [Pseudomonas sp. REB1044]
MSSTRSFWITGATRGLGMAMAQQLLADGYRVAVSGRHSHELEALIELHGARLLHLPGNLHELADAQSAGQHLQSQWGTLDALIINAGTCDYLAPNLPAAEIVEQILQSNWHATEQAVACALPLLARGENPRVMAIFSRYSALQRYSPAQSPAGHNSLPHWLREQRKALGDLGVKLTIAAPQLTKSPVSNALALPEQWTADSAAQELLSKLDSEHRELVLEVLDPTLLWPLPSED